MIWLMMGALLLAVAFIPVSVTADIHHGLRRLLRLHIGMIGLQREWVAEAVTGTEGHEIILRRKGAEPRNVSAASLRGGQADSLLKLMKESRPARRFLMAHTHAERIDAQLLLHTSSAAATALLTGGVQTALHFLPPRWRSISRICVLPDFLRDHSTLQARCIFHVRVGTLLITAGLLLVNHIMQAINREAQSTWNTPSEN